VLERIDIFEGVLTKNIEYDTLLTETKQGGKEK